jgi:hypothetical protein
MSDSPDSPESRAAELLRSLQEQLDRYQDVKRLAERQRQMIEANDSEGLMRLLAEKQEQIARIGAIAAASASLRESWERERDAASPALRQRLEKTAEDLRAVLAEIVAIEDQGQAAILGAREAAGEAITKLQKGKAMHKAYGSGPRPPGGRIGDKKA